MAIRPDGNLNFDGVISSPSVQPWLSRASTIPGGGLPGCRDHVRARSLFRGRRTCTSPPSLCAFAAAARSYSTVTALN
jgi:hypothetical protein